MKCKNCEHGICRFLGKWYHQAKQNPPSRHQINCTRWKCGCLHPEPSYIPEKKPEVSK